MFNANFSLGNELLEFDSLLQKRDVLVRTITSYMIAKSINQNKLSEMLGVSQQVFSAKMTYKQSFTDADIPKLLEILECDLPILKDALKEHRVLFKIKRELMK